MQAIPADVAELYEEKLSKAKVPASSHDFYKKWLQYFLDFCHKYGHDASDPKNLTPFIEKLESKNQSPAYQRQAQHAVILYHELLSESEGLPLQIVEALLIDAQPL